MMEYVRFLALFVVLFTLLTASPDGMLARLGLPHDALIAGLTAVVIAGLIHNYKLVFALAVLVLAVGANLPPATAANLGLERDYALAALLAALIAPWVINKLED